MALQFETIGFINFNKEFNKVLESGAITVSFTASTKNKDGKYETQYFNGLVPDKVKKQIKPLINRKVCKIKGVATPAQKGYVNFTILEAGEYKPKQKTKETETDTIDLPF